jgi:hypothetical protein
MGRTVGESSPAWPAPVRSTPGAPNVLYIVLDDTGYGQFGCYGSPINTPNLDRLAQNGLRYTNMHTVVGVRRALQYASGRSVGGEWAETESLSHHRSVFPTRQADIAGRPQLIRGNTQLLFDGMRVSESVDALESAVIEWHHVVLDGLDQPEALQLSQFLRILLREVVCLVCSRSRTSPTR